MTGEMSAAAEGYESSTSAERLAEMTKGHGEFEAVDGPSTKGAATPGFRIAGDSPVDLSSPIRIGDRGGIAFWFYLDQPYRSGGQDQRIEMPMIEAVGLFGIRWVIDTNLCALFFDWRDEAGDVDGMRVQMPSLPGPGWHHLAFTWDASAGRFTGYLDGTPMRLESTRLPAWKMGAADTLRFHPSPLALTMPELSQEPMEMADLQQQLPPATRGAMDHVLGAKSLSRVDLLPHQDKLLFEVGMTEQADTSDWIMEGPGQLAFEDEGMRMWSQRPEGPEGHIVYWCPRDLPANFIARWQIRPVSEEGLCIVFFAAEGREGQSIFADGLEDREGVFTRYHSGDINCYHISYYANTPVNPGRVTANLRKNYGAYLVSNGAAGIEPGSTDWHEVALMKINGRIVMNVDDRTVIDFEDDGRTLGPVLGGGKIGLRQMQWMQARYRNFRVYSVK